MPAGFLTIAVASSVAQLWNGYRQRQQTAKLEPRRENHQMGVIRQQHLDAIDRLELQNKFTAEQNRIAQEQMLGRQKDQQMHVEKMHRKTRRLQQEMERIRWELARLADGYPVRRGPFHLRRHLELCYPAKFPGRIPPVVLIPPLLNESNKDVWANARLHAQYLLGGLFADGLIHIPQGLPDRPFTWPDSELYRFDLLDVPTIIVSGTAAPDGVNIWLGGAHLLPAEHEVWPIAPARPILSIAMSATGESPASTAQFLSPQGRPFAVPTIRAEKTLDPQADQRQMLQLVSRGIELCVTRMVDTFHLHRSDCYDERFDDAVGRELAPAEVALLADGKLDPPIDSVKDAGYHLLHRARRSVRAGNLPGATKNFLDAFAAIGGRLPDLHAEVRTRGELKELLDRLVGPRGPETGILSDAVGLHLRLAAAVIAEFPAGSEPRSELSRQLEALNSRVGLHRAIGGGSSSLPVTHAGRHRDGD